MPTARPEYNLAMAIYSGHRMMGKCVLLLPVFGICCTSLPLASQQPTIAIESKNFTVASGQPIEIHIVLNNTTSRNFTVFRSGGGASGEQYYSVRVIGPNGNPAALTEYGAAMEKNRHQVVPLSRKMVTVALGAVVDEYMTISRMFDMGAPGGYIVQVSRPSPFNSAIILKSNTLKIEVNNRNF